MRTFRDSASAGDRHRAHHSMRRTGSRPARFRLDAGRNPGLTGDAASGPGTPHPRLVGDRSTVRADHTGRGPVTTAPPCRTTDRIDGISICRRLKQCLHHAAICTGARHRMFGNPECECLAKRTLRKGGGPEPVNRICHHRATGQRPGIDGASRTGSGQPSPNRISLSQTSAGIGSPAKSASVNLPSGSMPCESSTSISCRACCPECQQVRSSTSCRVTSP